MHLMFGAKHPSAVQYGRLCVVGLGWFGAGGGVTAGGSGVG